MALYASAIPFFIRVILTCLDHPPIMRRLMSADRYFIDPRELARRDSTWSGDIALDRFSRVVGFLEVPPEKLEASPNIEIELRFSQDAEGHYKLNGIVGFPAHCKCHRCLEPIDLLLEVELDAVLAFDEKEATSLGEIHEVIHLSRGDISVVDLIEDDLLLSIPKDVCELGERCENAPRTQYASGSHIDEKDFESGNPFAVLADLKKN